MRSFLFLQGPPSLFFLRLGRRLEADGHLVSRINLCVGDHFVWPRLGALNYRGSAKRWPAYLARVLEDRAITDVVMCGEQRALHKAALPVIHAHGARVVVTDFGYLRPDWITLELDGMSGLSRFPREPDAIHAIAQRVETPDLTARYHDRFARMATWEVFTDIITWFYWFLFPHYRSHLPASPARIYLSAAWRLLGTKRRNREADTEIAAFERTGRRHFLFPLQMETDFQIRAYSRFSGLTEPIIEVLDSFARSAPPDMNLVVKIHPLDQGLTRWDRKIARLAADRGLSNRVVVIDGGHLNTLPRHTEGVITINSTVGTWAIRAHRAVYVLGQAVYDVPGLTHQGELDSFWSAPRAPEPSLAQAWVRAVAGTIQIRGGYYSREGLHSAVSEAAFRLERGLVGEPLGPDDRDALARYAAARAPSQASKSLSARRQ